MHKISRFNRTLRIKKLFLEHCSYYWRYWIWSQILDYICSKNIDPWKAFFKVLRRMFVKHVHLLLIYIVLHTYFLNLVIEDSCLRPVIRKCIVSDHYVCNYLRYSAHRTFLLIMKDLSWRLVILDIYVFIVLKVSYCSRFV